MQRRNSEPPRWYFVPVKPGAEKSFRRWNVVVISTLAILVLGLFAAAEVPQTGITTSDSSKKVALKVDYNPPPVNLAQFQSGYASIINPALPAVVNISSTKVVKQQKNSSNLFSDPFFRQFFGNQGEQNDQQGKPESEREHSLGSGVVVNPDGYILTNNHVVDGASDIEVFTQDKKKFRAKVIGTDPRTDVAVLKINAANLTYVTLGNSSKLRVGDLVFAIGDPFGVGETATMGIVSATGRALGGAIEHYEDFIQTDAAINPGNSGGALLDVHGDLVGINTAILAGNGGGNQGIGFAIPIDMARNVMEQIVEHGKVVRGQLGVGIQGVDADMANAFGLKQGGGALVSEVMPGSPAAKAGIERGDIILALNGQNVGGPDDLSVHISEIAPGKTVHLTLARNGATRDVPVTLSELSEKEEQQASENSSGSALGGVQVENMTPSMSKQLGLGNDATGVVVTSVDPSSAAATADLQRGDVIQEVNRKPVHNVSDYDRAVTGVGSKSMLLLVNRSGATRYIVVSPSEG